MICYAFDKQCKQIKWSWQLQATLPFCLVLQRAEDFYTKKQHVLPWPLRPGQNTASWNKCACQFFARPYRPETSFFTHRYASASQPCMWKAECHLNEALITSAIQQSTSSTCRFTVWQLQSKNDIKIMEFSIPCFLPPLFFSGSSLGNLCIADVLFYTQFASALWYCSG